MELRKSSITALVFLTCALPVMSQQTATTKLADTKVEELDEVVISADAEKAFFIPESFGGSRTNIPNRELPQNIRVMSRQQLQDITAVRMQDSFDYVSGVSQQQPFGGLWENYAIRGFTGDSNNTGIGYMLNGFAANRGFNAPRDAANIEAIEFLKGPTAALFGAGDPGGTINVVTKKPLWEWQHSMQSLAGSFDTFRHTFDSTGPLTENFAYRFNYAYEDGNSFRDFVGSSRQLYAPAFTWKITEDTTLEYTGEFLISEVMFDRGIPAVNLGLGSVPRERFFGEPGDAPIQIKNYTNQLRLTHEFNDDWFFRLGVSHKINRLQGFASETRDVVAGGTQMRRRYRFRDYDSTDWSIQAEVAGKFTTGALEHSILVGTEYYWFELDQILLSGNYATNLFIDNPIYGQAKPALGTVFDRTEKSQGLGFYLQDQISFGKHWKLLLGGRYDSFQQILYDRANNRNITQENGAWTPRVGLTWLPTEEWSAFASYSQSFRPNFGSDSSLSPFDPEKGRAVEIGARYQDKEGRWGASLSLFDIQKRNVLRFDPADPLGNFMINGGQVNSRGVEFDLNGNLTDSFRLSASVTYQHAKIDESDAFATGTALLNIPSITANLLAVQEFELGRFGKLGIGGGVSYVGERTGNDAGTFDLPDYTTVRALAYWQATKNVRVTFDVDNLFDSTFYTGSVNQNIVVPGAARTFMAGVQISF
jgi:iron complex outermembrane recepter protein